MTHLITGRIDTFDHMAKERTANKLSRNMAYTFWVSTLVEYAEKYRSMQSIAMHDIGAYADVTLSTEKGGT